MSDPHVSNPMAKEELLRSRLSEVENLEHGWWGPESGALDSEALAAVRALLPDLARVTAPIAVTSSVDGAVVLQWRRGDDAYTAHIEPGHWMYLCADNTRTDAIREFEGEFDGATLLRFVYSGRTPSHDWN